jgi:hypothetical protein
MNVLKTIGLVLLHTREIKFSILAKTGEMELDIFDIFGDGNIYWANLIDVAFCGIGSVPV